MEPENFVTNWQREVMSRFDAPSRARVRVERLEGELRAAATRCALEATLAESAGRLDAPELAKLRRAAVAYAAAFTKLERAV